MINPSAVVQGRKVFENLTRKNEILVLNCSFLNTCSHQVCKLWVQIGFSLIPTSNNNGYDFSKLFWQKQFMVQEKHVDVSHGSFICLSS